MGGFKSLKAAQINLLSFKILFTLHRGEQLKVKSTQID